MAKILLFGICALMCSYVQASTETRPQSAETPSTLSDGSFGKIQVDHSRIVVKLKSSGQRFLIRNEDGALRKCEYGETVQINIGETITLIARDVSLSIMPLPTEIREMGYQITEKRNRESLGMGTETDTVYLIPGPQHMLTSLKDSDVAFYVPGSNTVTYLEKTK